MSQNHTKAGLEVLLESHIRELAGERVGILANQASVTQELVHISDALASAGVRIGALFGPEHGARGDAQAGIHVGDAFDEYLGVPVYSLYGNHRSPSPESLEDIDMMLIDLQDVGVRFYTFVHTMAETMTACGAAGIPVWVLDRPNPIAPIMPEGVIPADPQDSFFSGYPVPFTHRLTIGEMARMLVVRCGVSCDLRVIPLCGWDRGMWFDETGLPWVMPSPNIPTLDTAIVYPGTCLMEGTNLSEGRGTARPFEFIGAPWVRSRELVNVLAAYDLSGVLFRETSFRPWHSKFASERCHGIQIHVVDRTVFMPVLTAISILTAMLQMHPEHFSFLQPNENGRFFFDVLAGDSRIRESILAGDGPIDIARIWKPDVSVLGKLLRDPHIRLY